MLDTAHYYQRGRNEEAVGQAVKGRPRESYCVATKGRPDARDRSSMQDAEHVDDETYESYMQKCEISLRRLGLDGVLPREADLVQPELAGSFPPTDSQSSIGSFQEKAQEALRRD